MSVSINELPFKRLINKYIFKSLKKKCIQFSENHILIIQFQTLLFYIATLTVINIVSMHLYKYSKLTECYWNKWQEFYSVLHYKFT